MDSLSSSSLPAQLLLFAAAGILVTCGAYAAAGDLAALPGGAAGNMEAARAATAGVAHWMRLAGQAGIPGDIALAVASLLVAEGRREDAVAAAGWFGMAFTGLVFLVVDSVVAFVLPPLATSAGTAAAYAGFRAFFDILFFAGTFAGGASCLAIAAGMSSGVARHLLRAGGLLALASAGSAFLGWPLPQGAGISITVTTTALFVLALSSLRPASSLPGPAAARA